MLLVSRTPITLSAITSLTFIASTPATVIVLAHATEAGTATRHARLPPLSTTQCSPLNHSHQIGQTEARRYTRRRLGGAAQQQPVVWVQVPVGIPVDRLQILIDRPKIDIRARLSRDAHPAVAVAVGV